MSMDYDYPLQERQYGDNVIAFDGGDEDNRQQQRQEEGYIEEEEQQQQEGEIGSGEIERNQSMNHHYHHHNSDSSSAGKLFVGGVSWETTEDADRVLEEDHVLEGRVVEVKRTVPRDDLEVKVVTRRKKNFVGGIPSSLTEDELKVYFSVYGSIVDHQIMLDHKTGRSRGFGFVTFDSEDAVERIFSEGRTHEIGGKQVGCYGQKMGREYGGYSGYDDYSCYGGSYPGSTAGFYGGYGAYGYGFGFGFGGPMRYGACVYEGSGYGTQSAYSNPAEYGGGKGYGRTGDGDSYGSGRRYGNGNAISGVCGSNKGYGGSANGGAAVTGRFHPYRK
ncbi:hypothetical protein SADUNF_Sadunf01G0128800 [Salix dunnii]|uniref:RRM domain-containing protein n=1 Tax=Salix dunnii TaxID=1413687 RepID=A0A835TKB2_9ROSI|nr:hypothetical protein SADUNF_Sadunf01G0128800 [Salix dunnii]